MSNDSSPPPPRIRRLRFSLVRRFKKADDGATAVEFALVAVPFFALIFAIIEMSLIFFGTQMLETQTADSARLILTGQQQTTDSASNPNGTPKTDSQKLAAFKKTLCDPAPPNGVRSMLTYLFDCAKITVDVRSYAKCFSGADMASPIVNGKVDPNFTAQYSPGGPTDVVVVRVMYPWDTWVVGWPYRGLSILMDFSNIDGNRRLLLASAAFRNEPFANGSTATTCT